jgi:hypothetical protein
LLSTYGTIDWAVLFADSERDYSIDGDVASDMGRGVYRMKM